MPDLQGIRGSDHEGSGQRRKADSRREVPLPIESVLIFPHHKSANSEHDFPRKEAKQAPRSGEVDEVNEAAEVDEVDEDDEDEVAEVDEIIRQRAESLRGAAEHARRAEEADRLARREAIRARGLAHLEQASRERLRITFTELLEAGRELQQSLQDLLDSEPFWQRLMLSEVSLSELPGQELRRVQEAIDHDLDSILPLLGYHPPPPAVEMAGYLQDALESLVDRTAPPYLRAPRTVRARQELILFVWRLRRTLDQGDGAAPQPPSPGLRARVAAWVRTATATTVPAGLAAAAVAAGQSTAERALAAGVSVGIWEMVKKGVEVGSTEAMTRWLGTGQLSQPAGDYEQLVADIDAQMIAVQAVADRPTDDEPRRMAVFCARRSLYAALQQSEISGWSGPRPPQPMLWEEILVWLRKGDLQEAVRVWGQGPRAVTR